MFAGWEPGNNWQKRKGGGLSLEEVARLLEISKTAVLKRQATGRMLAWREERL